MSGIRRPEVKHVIGAAVAASAVALALAGGGFEPTAYAAAGMVVWIAVVVGMAVGVLPRSQPPRAALVAGIALAGLAAMTALSLAWASDDGNAFEDVVRALAYLGAFTAVVFASRRAEAEPWLAGLAIGLTAVGVIALLARFEPSLFGNPDADLADLPAVLGRLTYPIGYWNGLAAVMAAAIVLLCWFGASARSPGARSLAAAGLAPVILALWMTDSRGGIVAAGLAFCVLLATGPRRSRLVANLLYGLVFGAALILIAEGYDALLNAPTSPAASGEGDRMLVLTIAVVAIALAGRLMLDTLIQRLVISRRVGVAVLGIAAVAAIVGLIAIDPIKQYDEFKAPPSANVLAEGDVGLLRGGGSGRYQFWSAAADAFSSSPIGGVGSAGYAPYWFEHRDVAIPATRAHSVLFETLAELGIVGFGLLVTFFGAAVYAGVKRARAPGRVPDAGPALALLIVGLAAAAVDWTWDLPAVFAITVVAAALLTGPATLPAPDPGPPAREQRGQARRRRGFAGGVVLLLIAWISICGSGLLLLSAHSLDSSRDDASKGDLAAAVGAANDAIDLQPWSAEPRTQLALVYEQDGDYDRAREAIEQAIERSPDDYRLHLIASRMAAEAGDAPAARSELLTAHALTPRDPQIIQLLDFSGQPNGTSS